MKKPHRRKAIGFFRQSAEAVSKSLARRHDHDHLAAFKLGLKLNLGDFGLAAGILMLINAILNVYVLCKFGSPHAPKEAVTPSGSH